MSAHRTFTIAFERGSPCETTTTTTTTRKSRDDGDVCAICLEAWDETDVVRELDACKHWWVYIFIYFFLVFFSGFWIDVWFFRFHAECVDAWVRLKRGKRGVRRRRMRVDLQLQQQQQQQQIGMLQGQQDVQVRILQERGEQQDFAVDRVLGLGSGLGVGVNRDLEVEMEFDNVDSLERGWNGSLSEGRESGESESDESGESESEGEGDRLGCPLCNIVIVVS
jgi:hypothetical protein